MVPRLRKVPRGPRLLAEVMFGHRCIPSSERGCVRWWRSGRPCCQAARERRGPGMAGLCSTLRCGRPRRSLHATEPRTTRTRLSRVRACARTPAVALRGPGPTTEPNSNSAACTPSPHQFHHHSITVISSYFNVTQPLDRFHEHIPRTAFNHINQLQLKSNFTGQVKAKLTSYLHPSTLSN